MTYRDVYFTPEEIAYGIEEAERWGVVTTPEEYTKAVVPDYEGVFLAAEKEATAEQTTRVTGEIVNVMPSSIAPGQPVSLSIDYNAFHPGIVWTWMTRVKVVLDGMSAENTDYHAGSSGSRIGSPLNFNKPMPNRPISGTITLEYLPVIAPTMFTKQPIILDTRKVKILLPEQITPVTPSVPQEARTVSKLDETPIPDTLGRAISETLGISGEPVTIPGTETKVSRTFFYVGIAIAATALIYIFFIKKGK